MLQLMIKTNSKTKLFTKYSVILLTVNPAKKSKGMQNFSFLSLTLRVQSWILLIVDSVSQTVVPVGFLDSLLSIHVMYNNMAYTHRKFS